MHYYRKSVLLAFTAICLALTSCTPAPNSTAVMESDADAFAAIQAVLNVQVDAWNAGDIHAFMDSYWKSDSLRFASGGNVRRGWQATLDRYLATYPDKAAMGHLAFVDLEMQRLSDNWATVFGRYQLEREAPLDDLTGLFTLMFEKQAGGWIIVSDHTSAGN